LWPTRSHIRRSGFSSGHQHPRFNLLGAPAKEITRWADAPHKKSSLRAGYQRELDEARLGSIEKFLEFEAASTALKRIPETFYLKEWKKKVLDTGPGKAFFLEQMRKVAAADGKNVGSHALFRAE